MTQHKCGTCRYFEEGGFAGSGRCSHPLRKNLQQMVLVRKSELACRTDWADDLWEAKENVEPVPIASNPRFAAEKADPNAKRQFTDRVTAVGVAVARHTTGDTIQQTNREESVARAELDRSETKPSPSLETSSKSVSATPGGLAPQNPAATYEGRVTPDYQTRPDPVRDVPQSESAAESSERVLERLARSTQVRQEPVANPPRPSSRRDDPDQRMTRSGNPGLTRSEAPPVAEPRRETAAPRHEPERTTQRDRATPRESVAPRREEPVHEPQLRPKPTRAVQEPTPTFGARPSPPPDNGSLPKGRSGWTEPFSVSQPAASAVPTEAPARVNLPMATPPAEEPTPVSRPPSTGSAAPVVKPNTLRECCATCRDFRPAEGGDRGWCNNPYAFDHRQMVERTDLACKGTIGSWWVASDDWWLQRADISHHGRPTPIVDDLLRQLLELRMTSGGRRSGRG